MKKFYLLSLLALSAISMSAVAPFKATLKNATPVEIESNLKVRTAVAQSSEQPKHAPAKVTNYGNETWKLLGEGKYASQALANCYGGTTDHVDVTVYEAEGKTGLYKVLGVWPDLVEDGTLYIDATDPECVIVENQYTGLIDKVDGDTYIASLSYVALEEFGYTKEEFLASFSDYNAYVKNGVITFPAGTLCLQWPDAPADSQWETDPEGWYNEYSRTKGELVLPSVDFVDPWSEEVDATFVENIFSPFYLESGTTATVKVKKNSETNVYRIIDPWKGFYAAQGWNGESPKMEIDASDPNNAVIEYSSTGFYGGEDGTYFVYSCSYDLEDPSECPEEYRITVTEDGGNTVITFPINSMGMIGASSLQTYTISPAVSTITFKTIAGVDNITIDNNNDAKVEYFNLQGVRVENPAAGQLVIKRQGAVVTKEIIR